MHWQFSAESLSGLRVLCDPGCRSLLMFAPRIWRRWTESRCTHHWVQDEWGGGMQALPSALPTLGFASEGERAGEAGTAHGIAQIDASRLHAWKPMAYMTISPLWLCTLNTGHQEH